jgi:YD repeat-containing protein
MDDVIVEGMQGDVMAEGYDGFVYTTGEGALLSGIQSFETVNKNVKGYPYVIVYSGTNVATITYTSPSGTIIKTYAYDINGNIITITLSGAGLPVGINTVKTFTYSLGNVVTVSYS